MSFATSCLYSLCVYGCSALGLVPHGGVTKTLANSRHCVGTYMALTGAPLKAYNVMYVK